jgi:hypothetical protein
MIAKPTFIKGTGGKSSGCAWKAVKLTSGEPLYVTETGLRVKRCETERPARHEQLMEEVCERGNCWQAYKRVKANKGSPGIDGRKVGDLSGYLKQHWPKIREQLTAS